MPEYLSPGVYVEEIDAGPKPIEGVSTSTAGAIGVTERGPSGGTAPGDTTNRGKPVLVTSFAEFTRIFGGFLPEPPPGLVNRWALDSAEGGRWWLFPLSVKGFFDNGGQRLYVRRVFAAGPPGGAGATAAEVDFGTGIISEVTHDAAATDHEVQLMTLFGIQTNTQLTIVAGGRALAGPFAVQSYDPVTNRVTLNNPIGQELKTNRDFVIVMAGGAQVRTAGPSIRFRAKSVGDWGGNINGDHPLDGIRVKVRSMVGATLRLLSDPAVGGNPARTVLTVDIAGGAGALTVADIANFNNGDHVLISGHEYAINAAPNANNVAIAAAPGGAAEVGTTVTITTAANHNFHVGDHVTVTGVAVAGYNGLWVVTGVPTPASFTYTSPIAGLAASGGGNASRPTINIAPNVPAGVTWHAGTAVQRLRPANNAAVPGDTIQVQGAGQLYVGALVELDNGTNKEVFTVDLINQSTVTLSGNVAQAYYEGHRLRVIEAEVLTSYQKDGVVMASEDLTNLRLVDDGTADFLVSSVNIRSALVDVEGLPGGLPVDLLADFPASPPPAAGAQDTLWLRLDGGDDHYELLTVDDFVGVDGGSGARTGIQAMEDIEEVALCMVPNLWSTTVHSALINHCEYMKYRFAILDPQDGLSIDSIRTFREPLDTKYAALYHPWIEVRDPSVQRNVQVAPSGHMAGIYARVDVERGVHKAPANEVIESITKIAQDISKREQDMLNPVGINALRFFPNRGNRVWGARTVSSDSSWKYINVRRLFIYVEHSIDNGTQWVVFEPNDEPLWARVRQSISNFLTTTWRSGALQGDKPADAFFVKCDHTTMTQDDIDNGRLICVIGIAPVKPAEFVIFRIQQKTLDAQTS